MQDINSLRDETMRTLVIVFLLIPIPLLLKVISRYFLNPKYINFPDTTQSSDI